MQRAILHGDMDAFYAAVEQHDNPELRGRPVVVGAPPDKRGVVAAASYEARRFGIRSAMPSREAGKRCPHAVFLPPRMSRYEEVSRAVFAVFERFTPCIEPLSLDEAFLDVTGSRGLFGDGPAIARKIRQAVKEATGLTVSVGVAHNKFLAKIASDLDKPDGLTIVPSGPEEVKAFLAPLPVGRLWGVGRVTAGRLEKAGVRTIGDVQRMPLAALAGIAGKSGAESLKALADGLDDRAVEAAGPEQSISREHTFGVDVRDRARVEATLIGLVADVGRQLRENGRYAGGVQIKLRWQGFETLTRQMKLDACVNDDVSLRAAARELFGREKLVKPVRLVGFGVYALADRKGAQLSLFDDEQVRKREALSRTLDDLHRKYGDRSIGWGGGGGEEES